MLKFIFCNSAFCDTLRFLLQMIPLLRNDLYFQKIVDSLGNHKEEAGDTITCNIAFVGQGGFLGKFSVTKLKEINIGETPSDNFFRYSD